MKKDIIMPAVAGGVTTFNANVSVATLRGEFFHSTNGIQMNYRQIRLSIDTTGRDDKLTTIMIRPDTPGGVLFFDPNVLLTKDIGFVLHTITALDGLGNFLLKGTAPDGPFELPLSGNPESMNFSEMPGLLITEVRLPFEENDWARTQ